jgi:hypothetical protein
MIASRCSRSLEGLHEDCAKIQTGDTTLRCRFISSSYLILAVTLLNGVPVYSQESGNTSSGNSISTYDDCTEINIQYKFDETLTREEFINSMDAAFFESLNKFDACQSSLTNTSGGASGAVWSGDGSGGDGSMGGGSGTAAASSELSGTDSARTSSPSTPAAASAVSSQEGLSGTKPSTWKNPDANNGQAGKYRSGTRSGSGKTPDDIPPADNDSVLEAQIRQAAENETDPEIKKKLWDEYRKYKGIPRTGN